MEVIDNGQGMVVIVNGAESFLANGLKSKMTAAGINTIIVGRRIRTLKIIAIVPSCSYCLWMTR